MKKLNFWLKKLNFKIFLILSFFSLLSCDNSEKVIVEYKYTPSNNQLSAVYFNQSDKDYILIIPKKIFLNPYNLGKEIHGMDGLHLTKKGEVIFSQELYNKSISNVHSDFYFILPLERESEYLLQYQLNDNLSHTKYKKYKLHLVNIKDFESPIFKKDYKSFQKIKYKQYIPYIMEIKYKGDTILSTR
ncbi:hypothetical protein [Chryseobacterium sp. RLHN22]|uniref:hypothetical protein n=1 Tax=Chryseobacterium sp. RLHN22 TaxID=3437885 RepID=UPI003D9B6E22